MEKKEKINKKENIDQTDNSEAKLDYLEHRLKKDNQIKIEELILIAILIVICGILFYWQTQLTKQLEEARRVIGTMDAQIAAYQEKEKENVALAQEQQEKIQLLSDTLASKTEQLTAYQDNESARHIPSGYPVRGVATILAGGLIDIEEGEETLLEDLPDGINEENSEAENVETEKMNPNILYQVMEGTCVTATGTGKVIDIQQKKDITELHIDHENGYESIYKCEGTIFVNVGDEVSVGSVLMSIKEDNSYFLYQIKYEDKYIDPKNCMVING